MGKYIALLRGINVGGKNKVSMTELKVLLQNNGFYDVVTYINSGNIIFSSNIEDEEKLKDIFERIISEEFKLNIPVAIISVNDLDEALKNAPSWWDNEEMSKHNAIFVIPPATVDKVFSEVGIIKPEYEKIDYYGRVIFWSAPISTFSRTRLSKMVGTTLYDFITIRNANTAKKLIQLVK